MLIWFLTEFVSGLDSSGKSATAIEPMIVPGMVNNGNTIPVTIPYSLTAVVRLAPLAESDAGKIMLISIAIRLVPIRTIAMGVLSLIKGGMPFDEKFNRPPCLKKITIAIIELTAQAMV